MKTETLHDILKWTKDYHSRLANQIGQCEKQEEAERAKMVLGYLADHEKMLSKVIEEYSESASANALNTWCYDYLENYPIDSQTSVDKALDELDVQGVVGEVERRHNQIIGLYKHLLEQVETPSAVDLVKQLVDLEQHEAMRISQSTNRFQDL